MIEFYCVKSRKLMAVPEDKCVKRKFDYISKKNNKISKRYMVSFVEGELKLNKFLSVKSYSELKCREIQ